MADKKCILCKAQSNRVVSSRVKYGRIQPVVQCCRCGLVYLDPHQARRRLRTIIMVHTLPSIWITLVPMPRFCSGGNIREIIDCREREDG